MPIITTAAITLLVSKLAEKGLEKAFDTTVEKLSEDALAWIKKIFITDGAPRQEIIDLQSKSYSPARRNAVSTILERDIEDNPDNKQYLEEIFEKLSRTEISVVNSKNINTGNINSQKGDIRIGDNYER